MNMNTNWWSEIDFIPQQDRVLAKGDSGNEVREVQSLLRNAGFDTTLDGEFGPGTERSIRAFQKREGLVVDGRVGPKTLWRLKSLPLDRRLLTQSDIERTALSLGCQVAAVMAVNEVESRGSGFFDNGLPAILYERHVMYKQLEAHGVDPRMYVASMPDIVNPQTGGYVGGVGEYDRLAKAYGINPSAAQESASWGAFQIMGYHWARLGYLSVDDFTTRMKRSEADHLDAFQRFIEADDRLHEAMVMLDWKLFARLYNGPNYAKNQYDVKLGDAFGRHRTALKVMG